MLLNVAQAALLALTRKTMESRTSVVCTEDSVTNWIALCIKPGAKHFVRAKYSQVTWQTEPLAGLTTVGL